MTEINPLEEEREAIGRMARTPEGRLLHRYLRRVLEAVVDLESDGALRAHNGRRSLARDLMRLMAEGIDERTTDSAADTSILARGGQPIAVVRTWRDRARRFPRIDSLGPIGADDTSDTDGGNTAA